MNVGAPEVLVLFVSVAVVVAILILVWGRSDTTSERYHSALVSDPSPEAFIRRETSAITGLPKHTVRDVGTSALVVTYHYIGAWRVVVALLIFPIGLLALLGRDTKTATIAAVVDGPHTRVTLRGSFTGPLIERINSTLD